MNGVQPRTQTNYYLEHDHAEALTRVSSAITLFDPVKMAVGYLVPWIAAWISNQTELRRDDPLQEHLLNSHAKDEVFQKIDALKAAAEIDGDLSLYTSLDYNCSSYGGKFSLSRPVISIPLFFLRKKEESLFSPIEVENSIEEPPDYWTFTSDEITFFIAREMAHIKSSSFLQIVSKIFFLSAIFFFFTMTIPLLVSGAMIVGTGILYLISDRFLHEKLDIEAVHILTKYFEGDRNRAQAIAISAIQKLIDQNRERKERKSCWTAFYLTKAGNNLLDLDHPLLTTRLETIQAMALDRPLES